ncbi:MAG TPA: hypothetical protein VES42_24800 [Pilimelia sp.]|nr:hypothetical protein [Pilimelia sp.]
MLPRPQEWLRVLDTLSTRVHLALDDGTDWQQCADAFVRALAVIS